MSKQKLVMKYHPAKKEVEFHRYQSGKEVPIRNDSRLKYYMGMKGKFVLQDFGNTFFEDIAKAFDGLKSVDMEVITTKLDYADFLQMVEYYNEGAVCKINPTLYAELPDMSQTFSEVTKHGQQAIDMLKVHRQKLFEIPLNSENVIKSARNFARQMDLEIQSIREKIDSMDDNCVSLCFAGVYSAGKSALINAILGYKILPEKITSETAKMFQISSPRAGEKVKIFFDITGIYTELEWNEEGNFFEFVKGPSENPVREDIQKVINEVKECKLRQHEQIKRILDRLNNCQEVSSAIQIRFPIALDSENVRFAIYDTPGTDSNCYAHQQVLMDALEEQRQSILIFVAKPDGLEGFGNNMLLNYLKESGQKSSKTSIDIGRSMFVINKAETVTADSRKTLAQGEIKSKENKDFSIKLSDKKLFFTSALYAYAAKAVSNGIATKGEEGFFQSGKYLVASEANPMGYCYRQNRCAASEVATERMLQGCESALKEAMEKQDDGCILEICSGLYALEREILQYGEKYASAVKAFAIIDSVDKALAKLNDKADSLRNTSKEEISVVEQNMRELEENIKQTIEEEYRRVSGRVDKGLPVKKLKIDGDTLNDEIIGRIKNELDKEIKGRFFGHGKVVFKEADGRAIEKKVEQVIDEFTKQYFVQRKELLEQERDSFMQFVKQTIQKNGNISESAKKAFQQIPEPEINGPRNVIDVPKIYDSNKYLGKLGKKEYLNKAGFNKDMESGLLEMARSMCDDYGKEYRNSLKQLLEKIITSFESHLDEYSVNMKAMEEDKNAMYCLGSRIEEAAQALSECQDRLNEIIWKEIQNA